MFIGEGQFTSGNTFEIDGKKLEFAKACVATGARAAAPPIKGLDQVPYYTNETVFTLTELPKRIAFIGAGPIGCELAQAFCRFGSQVTLVTTDGSILQKDDPEAAEIVKQSLIRDGVDIRSGGFHLELSKVADGVQLDVNHDEQSWSLTVDALVVAAGRAPNVENLGLDVAGVDSGKRGIVVDDFMRTTNTNIFAAGDVASKYQFTHSADFMARLVIGNALFFQRSRASQLVIPWATYTEPELAHVGKTGHELSAQGTDYQTFTVYLNQIDRAILDGHDEGFVRAHVDRKGRILGATVVAAHAGDLISEMSVAMTNGIRLGTFAKSIHPYPTQAEALRKLGDAYNKTRVTPTVKKVMNTILRWRR
ncbi:MAG: FAD-dependent oxidoreductase [Planctomycetota bacterium]